MYSHRKRNALAGCYEARLERIHCSSRSFSGNFLQQEERTPLVKADWWARKRRVLVWFLRRLFSRCDFRWGGHLGLIIHLSHIPHSFFSVSMVEASARSFLISHNFVFFSSHEVSLSEFPDAPLQVKTRVCASPVINVHIRKSESWSGDLAAKGSLGSVDRMGSGAVSYR
ncbi:hypothetical protein BKA70DRAFT_1232587, partial [Coprinopsis sp. MPI-PUGE-AT-0042]